MASTVWTVQAPVVGGSSQWTPVQVSVATYQQWLRNEPGLPTFPSQAAAQAWANQRNNAAAAPGKAVQNAVNNIPVVGTAAKAIQGVGNIDDLISFLDQGAIWERVGEFLAGAIILYVGLKGIVTPAGQSPVKGTVRSTAKKVAKAAIFSPK